MPKFELHCLYWDNANPELVRLHRECLAHVGVDVIYTQKTIRHDLWLDELAKERIGGVDALGFIDIDCLPYSGKAVGSALHYALEAGSFIGLAQATNHVVPMLPIYASPAFMIISRDGFDALGQPSLKSGHRFDAAQHLSVTADACGFAYRLLYPFGFNLAPDGGPWRLGDYGWYGIGTEYHGGFFHLFQSRETKSFDLFRRKAAAIMAGEGQPASTPKSSTDIAFIPRRSTVNGRRYRRFLRNYVHHL